MRSGRCGVRPARAAAPLATVDVAQIAVRIGPFVPDGHFVIVQVSDVRVALQEPQQFVNNRAQVQFFCREQRKPFAQVEAHLVTERTGRSGSGAVAFGGAVGLDVTEQVEVSLHISFEVLRMPGQSVVRWHGTVGFSAPVSWIPVRERRCGRRVLLPCGAGLPDYGSVRIAFQFKSAGAQHAVQGIVDPLAEESYCAAFGQRIHFGAVGVAANEQVGRGRRGASVGIRAQTR